jgi:hypothetical protein
MGVTSRQRGGLALTGALVLVTFPVLIIQKIHASGNPPALATVYAGDLAAVAIAVTLLMQVIAWWWKGRAVLEVTTSTHVTAAAEELAGRMHTFWRQEAKERQVTTPAPARVQWRWGSADVTTSPAEVSTPPPAGGGPRPLPLPEDAGRTGVLLEAGVVDALHDEMYTQLPHGRLVLTGERGAGKTGAMILLLLAALDHRERVPEPQRGDVPVPVWLTLGGWDPMTQTLRQWATVTMYRDHPYLRATEYGPDVAAGLLEKGRVALFLDGLDEMAADARGKALERVQQEGAGLRIVLASRPNEFRQALSEGRLDNRAVIEVQPVDLKDAHAYLVRDQSGDELDKWDKLGKYLEENSTTVAARGLDNPLTLSLARDTYRDQDPNVLRDKDMFRTVEALREHLIARVLVIAYPDKQQRYHAIRLLGWIAGNMQSDRDLAWWHIPTWVPRWQPRPLSKHVLGLGVAVGFGTVFGFGFGLNLEFACAFGLLVGLGVGTVAGLGFPGAPSTVLPALRPPGVRSSRPHERSRLPVFGSLAFGLVFGVVFGLLAGLVGGPKGFVSEPKGGLVFALVVVVIFKCMAEAYSYEGIHGVRDKPHAISARWPRLTELPQLLGIMLMIGINSCLLVGVISALVRASTVLIDQIIWILRFGGVPVGTGFHVLTPRVFGTRDFFYVVWEQTWDFNSRIMAGFLSGLWDGLSLNRLEAGLVIGLPLGLMLGLGTLWRVSLPNAAATPATSYHVDRRASTLFGLVTGLAWGLVLGLAFGLVFGPWAGLWAGLLFGLVGGFACGVGSSPMPMVSLTELTLATGGAGRVRFMQFLDDAHHRQVLRQAGAVYQFRHAELQDHLAKIHHLQGRTRG